MPGRRSSRLLAAASGAGARRPAPGAPRPPAPGDAGARRLRPDDGRRDRRRDGPLPARAGADRRRRADHVHASCGGPPTASAASCATAASGPGSTVGILARNGRVFVLSLVAATKVGADIVYLNTGFAGPQLADVVAHEGVDTILHDDVFADIVAEAGAAVTLGGSELRALGRDPSMVPLTPSRHVGRQVILTSGTTGRPKGAARRQRQRRRLADAAARGGADPGPRHGRHRRPAVPRLGPRPPRRRARDVVDGGRAGAVRSRGHAGRDRRAPRRRRSSSCPVMLQRILALGGEVIARYDTSSLRYIASSGSALGAPLATAVIRRFGPILYNIYGSTEVSLATIATPGRPAGGAGDGREGGAGQHGADPRRRRRGGADRRRRAGLRRQRRPLRRLHRRRRQGADRRPAVERRPRPLRHPRPPVHRRPRRRHDRVRRRERVPGRGRGPARRPPGDPRGRRHRRARRGVRPAAQGVRRAPAAAPG